jgi:hypothetical protein
MQKNTKIKYFPSYCIIYILIWIDKIHTFKHTPLCRQLSNVRFKGWIIDISL